MQITLFLKLIEWVIKEKEHTIKIKQFITKVSHGKKKKKRCTFFLEKRFGKERNKIQKNLLFVFLSLITMRYTQLNSSKDGQ